MLQQLLVDLQSSSKASSSTSRTRPTSFSISASEVEEQMKDIFGDAQGAIDAVNSEAKRLFEGSFSRTFEALRSVTDERQHVWQDLVLGKHGLAAYCSKLKQLLEEVDANTESCQKAQDLWKKKGRAATPGSGADGDKKPVENANEKHLLIQGCANEAYKSELRPVTCETTDQKLLCTWLRESVIPENGWADWFSPGGKCLISPEASFNQPLLDPSTLQLQQK